MRVLVESAPPLIGLGTVFAVAGAVLVIIRPTMFAAMTTRSAGTVIGVGLCLLGAQGVVVVAVRHLYAGTAAVLVASTPLWVAVVSAVFDDRNPSRVATARVVVGFAGVCVVLVGSDGVGSWSTRWAAAVIGASIVWALGTYWASTAKGLPGAATTTAVQLVIGGATLVAVGLVVGELDRVDWGRIDRRSWAAFAYLVLFDSLAGFALFHWLVRHSSIRLVSSYSYIVPVVAYAVGVVVLGEPVSPIVVFGSAIVIAVVASEAVASNAASIRPE